MPTQSRHYTMEIKDGTVTISKCHPGPDLEVLGIFSGDIGESMSLWIDAIETLHTLSNLVVTECNDIDRYYGE